MKGLRGLWGAAAGVAAALGLHAAHAALLPPPARERLAAVPDDRGAFREIVLHAEASRFEAVAPTYRDLLRALPRDVRVTVAVPDATVAARLRGALAAWGVEDPSRVRFVEAGKPITTWSRDRYTLLRGARGRPVLLCPPRVGALGAARANDWEVPFLLAEGAGAEVRIAPFHFDGGDLLVTEERVYATAALLAKNVGITCADRASLVARLEETLGRKAAILGDRAGEVPDHHICMVMTPLPGGRMAVGDPRAGRAWAERLAIEGADLSEETARRFDAVANALEREGVAVVRVPLVPLRGERSYITYQNGVIEERGGEKVFYMPVYGLAALDAAAARLFEEAGMRVVPISARAIFRDGGSVRCLVNVMGRDA